MFEQSVSDEGFLLQYDEMGMVDAVATRNPVSLAFEVTSDFMHYSQGVYTRWAEAREISSCTTLEIDSQFSCSLSPH